MVKKVTIILSVMLFSLSGGAFAYDFWGITMGTSTYNGAPMLTFSQPADGIGYQVGAYQYTQVGANTPEGPFAPASPGPAYPALQRASDAMGLFYKAEQDFARFMIVCGMPDTGIKATEIGYGNRQFGPGDLMIDVSGGSTYGIGFRAGGLLWAADPTSTAAWFQIYNADGTTASMYARDAGNIGTIVENPNWAHVDNYPLAQLGVANPSGAAFFISGTGTNVGTVDSLNIQSTGVFLDGVQIYAYEVAIPWAAIGLEAPDTVFQASWRPDCGNDIIYKSFTSRPNIDIPEPYSMVLAITGLAAVAGYRRRRA